MTFTRFLGIGIATIIYGLCTVGWADVKPINPSVDCKKIIQPPSGMETFLNDYKTNGDFVDGRYVICFDQTEKLLKIPISFKSADSIVVYGLNLKPDLLKTLPADWVSKTLFTVSGNNVLLQNAQITGPGNAITGSIGLALSGSGHSIITSSITGFETGIQANCLDASPGALNDKVNCTISPKTVTDNVKYGVVVPTTGQGVTITQNEIRTIVDPYGNTTQKIVLQGAANGGLTPPIFSIDPATMTIWKTLTADKQFVTEIGGVLPKAGMIELFEHHNDQNLKTYTDYFRASCPTTQNDKGQFEFKCTGLNISAKDGIIFTNVTYIPNTSAMTKLIDVKDIPDKKTTAINPVNPISTEGGALTDPSSPSSPPAGDGGLVVGGAGETVAMNDGGLGGGGMSPPPDIKIDDASTDGGTAAAMTGGAMVLAGDGAPSAGGASSGCGGQLMPEKTPVDPTLFVILLMPIVLLLQVRRVHSRK